MLIGFFVRHKHLSKTLERYQQMLKQYQQTFEGYKQTLEC